MVIVVCCYKQKTAYDLRISDWSSDGCSSDLARHLVCAQRELDAQVQCQAGEEPGQFDHVGEQRAAGQQGLEPLAVQRPDAQLQRGLPEIGSTSCRERVCQSG